MKIWFVHQFALPPKYAGITRHFSLAQEFLKQGHHITIIAAHQHHRKTEPEPLPTGENWKFENYEGVNFIWLKNPNASSFYLKRIINMFSFGWKVIRFDKTTETPDIIIGCSPDLITAYSAYILSKRLQSTYIAHIGDFWPLVLTDMSSIPKYHPFILFLGWLEKQIYKKAKAIISPLPGGAQRLQECGISNKKFFYAPNGVKLDNLPKVQPLPDKPFTFMFAGSHSISCCLDQILDSISLFQKNHPALEAHFRFIGEGTEKQRLIDKAKNMKLKNVYFENAVSKEDIFNKLSEAHAFINAVPNKKSYSYGISMNKLFDYMSAGRPIVIAVNSYNNPVEEWKCGLSVEAENTKALSEAMASLTQMNKKDLTALGERGRKAIENYYNFERIGQILEKEINNL